MQDSKNIENPKLKKSKLEYYRKYNAEHREQKRLWQKNNRDAVKRGKKKIFNGKYGNEKYKELVRQEQEWLKGHPLCKICGFIHPPMTHDYSS